MKYNSNTNFFKLFALNKTEKGDNNPRIMTIEEDFAGKLWIGTFDGRLLKFDRFTETFKQVIPFLQENELIKFTKIFSIYESNPGIIWFGTNLGLYCYNDKTSEIKRLLN